MQGFQPSDGYLTNSIVNAACLIADVHFRLNVVVGDGASEQVDLLQSGQWYLASKSNDEARIFANI